MENLLRMRNISIILITSLCMMPLGCGRSSKLATITIETSYGFIAVPELAGMNLSQTDDAISLVRDSDRSDVMLLLIGPIGGDVHTWAETSQASPGVDMRMERYRGASVEAFLTYRRDLIEVSEFDVLRGSILRAISRGDSTISFRE